MVIAVLFKEHVRYPLWTCRDPIFSDSRDTMIDFSDSRDPNRVLHFGRGPELGCNGTVHTYL